MNLVNDFPAYQVENKEFIKEIESQATVYQHKKSGARLLVLCNDDDNKSFCAGFRTIPGDDSGVAHIMEHSVLCGSRKYPVKEPFVELMKGSLNTFLNAMTYPDKTVYPVASCNEEDFHNLMDVYMDSVFFPELSKEAFLQEGWHYEVGQDKSLNYKGVVYNEMKGVYSSPESILFQHVDRLLYADTPYSYDSGGVPESIPDLSYEQYLDFHKENYHPSNCWIVLYGDMDVERCLKQLDEEFLIHFDKRELKAPRLEQPLFSEQREATVTYAAAPGETKEKSFIGLSYLLCDNSNLEEITAMQVLDHILTGTSASPLRKAIMSSGLGGDILNYGFSDQSWQCSWSIGLRDTEEDRKQDFLDLFEQVLTKLVEEGIPDKLIEAAMNTMEFRLREANFGSYPKGVVYALSAISAWNYDCDPLERFKYEQALTLLKENIAVGGYFEGLIKRNFLANKHRVIVVCKPDEDEGARAVKEQEDKLAALASTLNEDDFQTLRDQQEKLLLRQTKPDSPEALASIPALSRQDIKKEIEVIPTVISDFQGAELLFHSLPANGVVYLKFVFDVSALKLDELPLMNLLGTCLMQMGAGDWSFEELTTEVACRTGGLGGHFSMPKRRDGGQTRKFVLSSKVMVDKLPELIQILIKLKQELDFSDETRLAELLSQSKSRLSASFVSNGEWLSRLLLNAGINEADYCQEKLNGPSYLKFIEQSIEQVKAGKFEFLRQGLMKMKKLIFNKSGLIINLTCREEDLEPTKSAIKPFLTCLDSQHLEAQKFDISLKPLSLGLATQGKVQYVTVGVNLRDQGIDHDGLYVLLNQLLSTGYLWERVRVQGGAYGCFLSYNHFDGVLNVTSYRDPNLRETLDVYRGIADCIRDLKLSEEEFEKILIGTFGRIDGPLTPSQKGGLALNRHLSGIDAEWLQARRDELLGATQEQIRVLAAWFDALNEKALVCVHGNEEKVREAAELFDRIDQIAGAGGDDDDDDEEDDEDDFC